MRRNPERIVWFVLAERLHMSVAEAQRKVSSEEFLEWMVYDKEKDRKSPMGPEEIFNQMEAMRKWRQPSATSRQSSL